VNSIAAAAEPESPVGLATRRARLALLLAAVLWSLAGVFIKFLSLNPLTIVFYRSFFASLFFSFCRGKSASLPPVALLVAIFSYAAAISTFVSANKLTTAANAIVLQYTAPFFVFLAVHFFFREKIAGAQWGTLIAGMAGIAVIFAGSAGEPDAAGVVVALFSGVLFSIYMVSLRFLKPVHPGTLTFVTNFACCLMLLPLVWSHLALNLSDGLILAVMGVVQLGIPYWLFARAVTMVSIQEASLIVLIEPVLNPIWVALTVGEVPSAHTVLGGGLIVASLAVRYAWVTLNRSAGPG
jgi:drug/metabolite transporter (DMT)-like permease